MKQRIIKGLYIVLMVVLIGIFGVSAYQVFTYEQRSEEEASQIDDLRNLIVSDARSGSIDSDANEVTADDVSVSTSEAGIATADPNAATFPPEEKSGSSQNYVPWVPSEPPQLLRRTDPGIEPYQKYQKLINLNSDFVGWIRIPGTNVDYPVMHTPNDPQKYLHLNFYGIYAYCGLPFVDCNSTVSPDSDNIIIYAHHMKDGSMFMNLAYYESQYYFWNHSTVYFDTLWHYGTYQIFAVVKTSSGKADSWHFNSYINFSQESFDEYVGYAVAHSLYATGVTPVYGDKILTLSTCEYSQTDGRLVVLARKVAD